LRTMQRLAGSVTGWDGRATVGERKRGRSARDW
jgi:hypothetical protein